jgi:hypothetical protein
MAHRVTQLRRDARPGGRLYTAPGEAAQLSRRSAASNLVTRDTNGREDIFVHDLGTGVTERVSVSSSGIQAKNNSDYPAITADGRYVSFSSLAGNLITSDTNRTKDVFVHDRGP